MAPPCQVTLTSCTQGLPGEAGAGPADGVLSRSVGHCCMSVWTGDLLGLGASRADAPEAGSGSRAGTAAAVPRSLAHSRNTNTDWAFVASLTLSKPVCTSDLIKSSMQLVVGEELQVFVIVFDS